MNKVMQIRLIFKEIFIVAILILCGGFIVVSCGKDPQQKVDLLDKGNYAVDLSLASTSVDPAVCDDTQSGITCDKLGAVWVTRDKAPYLPSLAGTELTVEAWIKSQVNSPDTLSGGIFSRYDSGGVIMWVKDDQPKFGIRIPTGTGDTSTTYPVESGTTTEVASGDWTHIAGVLVNSDHSSVHAACGGAESQTPHLDIYVNGQFKDCALTGSQFAVDPTYAINKESIGIGHLIVKKPAGISAYTKTDFDLDGLDITTRFNGIIDEVRLWTVARTAAEIQACMSQELGIEGTCARTSSLKGYWRFDANKGGLIHEFSGNGFTGAKNEVTIKGPVQNQSLDKIPSVGYPSTTIDSWSGGWATGYPF